MEVHVVLCFKGWIMSEDTGDFSGLKKNIPNLSPKLLHPVHDNDTIFI